MSTNNNESSSSSSSKDEVYDLTSSSALHHTIVVWIGSTTSMVVAMSFFAVLAYQRDAFMVSFFMGAIANGILSKILKKLLNQERPAVSTTSTIMSVQETPSDKGMPSSHAMSLGFIGTVMGRSVTAPWQLLPIAVYVAISLYYRVYTQLHTKAQVAVGLLVGMMNGAIWQYLCTTGPILEWVSNTMLNENGLLPIPLLVVPALVGALVVGSLERRIQTWIKKSD